MFVREFREKDPLEQDELEESVRMAVEIGDDISCESNLNPVRIKLIKVWLPGGSAGYLELFCKFKKTGINFKFKFLE